MYTGPRVQLALSFQGAILGAGKITYDFTSLCRGCDR